MTNQKVWSKFNKTVKGNEVSFSIPETQKYKIKFIVDLIIKYVVSEDPFCTAACLGKCADASKEYKELLVNMIREAKHQVNVVFLYDADGTIIGASIMALTKKEDPEIDFDQLKSNNKELQKLFEVYSVFYKKFNILKDNGVNSCYNDWGIVVLPEYKGIEEIILKTRVAICKDQNVPLASAWMYTPDRIQAGERSGWETASEINFVELGKETGVSFPGFRLFLLEN